jgi:hypothetical protein
MSRSLSDLWHPTLALIMSSTATGQDFGSQQVISTQALCAHSVHTADLDKDGDADVLSASWCDNKIAWYENLGGGSFGSQQVISTQAHGAHDVHTADLDGDGDLDVLSASESDFKIAWYENLGGGSFGSQQVISTLASGAHSVHAADLDDDGDVDVLSASESDDKIAWYENLGGGSFGPQHVITTLADRAYDVGTADLDGDGDLDVLSASAYDDKIAWYENLGSGSFGPQQIISTQANYAHSVHVADLDGDGDTDVLSASIIDHKIAWYENQGGGNFGSQQVISTQAYGATSVHAVDLDGDGDTDVLSASEVDDKIAWYENRGGRGFGNQQVISTLVSFPTSVHAADLDGDGDADVLSSSWFNPHIAWYENLMGSSWTRSTQNGHWYAALEPATWTEAETRAQTWAGHLTTIRNQAENDWLASTFAGDGSFFWIGYHDSNTEGQFEWASGETPGYENWSTGEPDDNNGADWAVLIPAGGTWMDETLLPERRGIMEVISDDCDGDNLPDAYEIALNPALDWNGDGVLDGCTPANYCTAAANSTGVPAVVGAAGSPLIADNAFTLEAWDMPQNEFAYFLMSESTAFVPGFGGSSGNLCVGAPIVRLSNPAASGGVLNSGTTGTVSLTMDLTNLPPGTKVHVGDTWYFQLWFRDFTTGPTSNTTDGIEVMFR